MDTIRRSYLVFGTLLILIGVYLYAPGFGNFFYNDDFRLLGYSHYRDYGEVLSNVYPSDHFDNSTTPYWRTGWYLLFKVIHQFAGLDPMPFILTGVCLHLLIALLIYIMLCRYGTPTGVGFLASILFLSSPSYLQGVFWPSASLNVLPAALFHLIAAWSIMAFIAHGRFRYYLLCFLSFLISLTFKESAYNLPLLIFAAFRILDPKPLDWRKIGKMILFTIPFGLAVCGQYFFLTHYKVKDLSPFDLVLLISRNTAGYFNRIFHTDLSLTVVWCIIIASFLLIWFFARRRSRFFFIWTLLSVFPFAAITNGDRFSYFTHIPLALVLGTVADSILKHTSWKRIPGALLVCLLVAIAIANMSLVGPAIEKQRLQGEECRRILTWFEKENYSQGETVYVDVTPPVLENGFEMMIDLFLGKKLDIQFLHLFRQPPFAVYKFPSFTSIDPEETVLKYLPPLSQEEGPVDNEPFLEITKSQLLGKLSAVPLFGFRFRYEVMDPNEALKKIWKGEIDVDHTVLLDRKPSIPINGPISRKGRILKIVTPTPREIKMKVFTPFPCLFLIDIKANFHSEHSRVSVDGKKVQLFRANGMFHALELTAGRHEIELSL